MTSHQKISIAITGHTNTGKTSLIRTLMKQSVGEVRDRANVTVKGQAYYYDSLQANFIDTPGFRFVSIYSMYLDMREEDPTLEMPTKWKNKIDLELDAFKAIEESTAAIYVGSLSVVPDDSHIEEIKVVKRLQSKVIGILNKYNSQIDGSSKSKVEERIKQWENILVSNGIDCVIDFDAHWDKYSKVQQIYDGIYTVINDQEKNIFHDGLNIFKERQKGIRNEACSMLANCVKKLQGIAITARKGDYSEEEIATKISEEIRDTVMLFIIKVNQLYKVAAEFPNETRKDIKIHLKFDTNLEARFDSATGVGAAVATGGGAIGAAIGAAIAGLLSGGLGAGAGAILGAQIGAAIGGGFGSLAVFYDDDDTVTVQMKPEEIEDIAIECLAIIWGLSVNGYGRDRNLTNNEIKEIEEQVRKFNETSMAVHWSHGGRNIVIQKCEEILDKLES